ncbi:anion permease [Helicobacter sp. 16-1353]|uniref:DASS family sodium-coupled anion symporter n=1 Tax=Helicobacter sp. 16-1353 TaxID=2004996 RepID=UPI000DCDB0EB|nr:DASS family sodium-coupled anion symporter [Helicobacter sp. 16-1353]RAX51723.1 anion permease [Helicobacter sp. 16-1353]
MLRKYFILFLPVIVSFIVFILPTPDGLSTQTWLYFSIFLGVVVGLIQEIIPSSLIGIIGVCICVWCKVGPIGSNDPKTIISADSAISWGLSGFANSTVCLVFIAFMIGLGYQKSGLGRRIALLLVKMLGKTTLGLGYAIAIADGVLAPFIPSNTARTGGTLYPIVSQIPPMMGSYPDKEPRKIGGYIAWVSMGATCLTSSMFLTALSSSLLAVEIATKAGVEPISWFGWFMSFLPAGIILFLAMPFLTYIFYPPTEKGSPSATIWAKEQLEKIGPMTLKEWLMIGLAIFALVFWIGGNTFGVHATTVALTVMIAMVLLNIITWNDVLTNKPAWMIFLMLGSLVTLADGLKNVGFLEFIVHLVGGYLGHFNPMVATIGLIIFFFFLHYFFASTTAHVTALLALFITIAQSINGIDIQQLTLFLMLSLGIMGILTPYGTGPSPIWFGSGYIAAKDFWRLGFIFGVIYLVVFLVVCIPWVKYVAHIWI